MKTTTIKSVLLIAFISLSAIGFAQSPMGPPPENKKGKHSEKRENIEAMKVAFITQKLNLTLKKHNNFGQCTISTTINCKSYAKKEN